MNTAVCHCGEVSLSLARMPAEVFECNCSICRRLGVLWAYYHCADVVISAREGATKAYVWNNRVLEFHSCERCGCTTHWAAVDSNFRERMGVNARLIDGLNRTNTKLGYVDHGDLGWYWSREQE